MNLYRLVLVSALLCVVGFAPAPFPRPVRQKAAQSAILGLWEIDTWEENGERREIAKGEGKSSYSLEFEQGKVHVVLRRGKTTHDLRLEPDALPQGMAWSRGGRVVYVGSYRVEGDRLTMVFKTGTRYDERPTDFGGKPEFRFVLRRARRGE